MGKKLQKLVLKKNFSSSNVTKSPFEKRIIRPFDDDDEESPLSKWVKNRNASIDQEANQSTTPTDEIHPIRKLNRKVSYEIMPGYRFNSKVLFCPDEQQFYLGNSASEYGLGYTCYVSDCKCRVHLRNNECYIGNAIAHNHEKKTGMYYNLLALNEVKRILRSQDNQLSPEEVFNDVIKRHPKCKLVFKELERGLRNIQNELMPKVGVTKKRARSNNFSKSKESFDDESIAKKKKTKQSAISSNVENDEAMDATFSDEDIQIISSKQTTTTESKRNTEPSRQSIPTHDQCKCKCNKENQLNTESLAFQFQTIKQSPQIPMEPKNDEYMCQIYVRETDLNRLIQSGNIFINQGRFYYK